MGARRPGRSGRRGRPPDPRRGPRPRGRASRVPRRGGPRLSPRQREVVVIGGGQAGLAAGYYLRRAGVDFAILDAAPEPGGAWRSMWPSLRTFSPTQYSSLPGWMMPPWTADDGFPLAAHVVEYLTRYEQRYDLPVVR
ncbi:MAG TPA: FAD-dependent oxidoreductase, partial [Nocardioidaceae bacterium]